MTSPSDSHNFLQEMLYDIAEAGKSSTVPHWASGGAVLSHHAILYVVKGDGEILVNGESSSFGRNSLIVHAPGTSVEIRLASARPVLLYSVCFDMFRLSRKSSRDILYLREDSFPMQGTFRTGNNDVYRLMHMLAAGEASSGGAGNRYMRQQLLHDVLDALIKHAGNSRESDVAMRLRMTIDYMHRHYNERIRMSELAELGQFHPAYYSQIFKQLMNKTPMAYLTHLRMNKAAEMLMTTDKPVSHVAANVGYEDEFYFSKRFKETNGYSPSVIPSRNNLKVISLSASYTDHLFTLGLTPSAAQVHSYMSLATQSLSLPEHAAEPWRTGRDLFLEIKPDLILCKDNVWDKAQQHINDVAPIIAIPWKSRDIYRHMADIAELVDKKEQAGQWLNEYRLESERWRKKLKPIVGNATVALCVCQHKELRMYGARSFGHVFYRSLGLEPPQKVREQIEKHPVGTGFAWMPIRPEELSEYEADILFIAVETADDERLAKNWLHTLPAWRRHPAVRGKQVYFVDWKQWIIYAPQAIREQLHEAGHILAALAGGPAI